MEKWDKMDKVVLASLESLEIFSKHSNPRFARALNLHLAATEENCS